MDATTDAVSLPLHATWRGFMQPEVPGKTLYHELG